MTDQQQRELIEYGQERRVTADEVMDIIAAENYCSTPECDFCEGTIKAAIRTLAETRLFEGQEPYRVDPKSFYSEA